MNLYGRAEGTILALQASLADCDVGLRWGGSRVPGQVINGQVHLLNGLEQLQAFEAAEVSCPKFTTNITTAALWADGGIELGSPIFGRKFAHSQGKDIISFGPGETNPLYFYNARRKRAWASSDFWVRYVPSVREWRFHILRSGGTYLSIGRALKVWRGEGPEPPEGTILVRSRRLGWHLDHSVKPPAALRDLAKRACEACAYELGAVDILELADGTGCVLEVNSRPALRDPYTLTVYTNALKNWKPNA